MSNDGTWVVSVSDGRSLSRWYVETGELRRLDLDLSYRIGHRPYPGTLCARGQSVFR